MLRKLRNRAVYAAPPATKMANPAEAFPNLSEEQGIQTSKRKKDAASQDASENNPEPSSKRRRFSILGKSGKGERRTETGNGAKAHYLKVPLDMARTAIRYMRPTAAPAGNGSKEFTYNDKETVITHHEMTPDPNRDDAFPILDPSPSLAGQVHRFYAAKSGKEVDPRVKLLNVKIATGETDGFVARAEREATKPENRLFNLSKEQVHEKILMLQQSVRSELERLIEGRKLASPTYFTRELTDTDIQAHEKMLVGQNGLFVRSDLPKEEMPTLTNGKILGLFSGAYLKSTSEHTAHFKTYGGVDVVDRYSLNIRKPRRDPNDKQNNRPQPSSVTVSPIGVANSMAFANTATTPDFKQYDEKRINAIFVPFHVTMRDKYGKEREELVAAVVAFDNLHGQVLLHYGDHFLKQLQREEVKAATDKQKQQVSPADLGAYKPGTENLIDNKPARNLRERTRQIDAR